MNQNNQSRLEGVKDKLLTVKDWILDHRKIVMPAILIVCVFITVLVAVNANQRDKLEKEAEAASLAAEQQMDRKFRICRHMIWRRTHIRRSTMS